MKNQIASRLKELQEEYQKGQERLTALEKETVSVQNSVLRISGAIQVLQELLEEQETKVNKQTSNKQSVNAKAIINEQ